MQDVPADGVRVLADLGPLRVGVFRCPPGSPRWRSTNCIGPGHHVVFPRRPVRIRQAGGDEFVADATQVVVYASEQEYDRSPAGPGGDVCDFISVDPGTLPADQPTPGPSALPALLFLQQRQLLADTRRRRDPLAVEEGALAIVAAAMSAAVSGWPAAPAPRSTTALVEAAKEILANRYAEDLRLADLARPLFVSPFHLARAFRAGTGQSLHGYRTELRLRAALDRMAEGDERLCDVAAACGFASHSHLSDVFRRRFGTAPAKVRRALAAA